ncbi:Ankyrin repeat and death domain containing protein 1A, partial [Dissostichus eleginoides]
FEEIPDNYLSEIVLSRLVSESMRTLKPGGTHSEDLPLVEWLCKPTVEPSENKTQPVRDFKSNFYSLVEAIMSDWRWREDSPADGSAASRRSIPQNRRKMVQETSCLKMNTAYSE